MFCKAYTSDYLVRFTFAPADAFFAPGFVTFADCATVVFVVVLFVFDDLSALFKDFSIALYASSNEFFPGSAGGGGV